MIDKAVGIIRCSKYCFAFTGAGISVESGIPPFRGENSLWSRYNPEILDLDFFLSSPEKSWPVIKEIFYDFFGQAKPNSGHWALAKMEAKGYVKSIVTQNIDNLHHEAGSKEVYEFHGNSRRLVCTRCDNALEVSDLVISEKPMYCDQCGALLKPDFIFFGEGIPELAYQKSMEAARRADVCLIVGSTGEVMPAAMIPFEAKRHGAVIIEVNPRMSQFTSQITDIYLKGEAGEVLSAIEQALN